MRRELALLPLWYAAPEDYVLTEEDTTLRFLPDLPGDFPPLATPVTRKSLTEQAETLPQMEASPWGLSPQSIRMFNEIRQAGAPVQAPVWKEAYSRLTGRVTAAGCLEKIKQSLPGLSFPDTPRFCTTLTEVEQYMASFPPPFVLKTPFSSSGRGLLWVQGRKLTDKEKARISGAVARQGSVSIECGLDKEKDFAMEFFINPQGHVAYKGLSLFETAEGGAYNGNRLERQESLGKQLTGLAGSPPYPAIRTAVTNALQETYAGVYSGYLGVDMMIYKTPNGGSAVHPCVEINMRYTMGMVAVRLFERFIDAGSAGRFQITCSPTAFDDHCAMQEACPRRWKGGKLVKGYLPLCPVQTDSRFRAFVRLP
jgi:hypothetical protein